MIRLDIPLQPRQLEVLALMDTLGSPRNIAFGGARGGAKSHAARAIMLIRRLKYPGTNGLILRKTYPELLSSILNPMFAAWPQLRKYYSAQTKILTLPTNPPSLIEFRTADDSGRIARMQGSEFLDVNIDEAGQFDPLDLTWLQTVNRYVGKHHVEPHTLWTANPGGIAHSHIKRLFVDRDFRESELPGDFAFVQSFAQDNVEWSLPELRADGLTPADYYSWTDKERFDFFVTRSQYGRLLNSLPDALKGPHLYGDWNTFAGQFFDLWDPAKHVRSTVDMNLQPYWPRWASCDWGFSHDAAIYWFASDEEGNYFCYRELVLNGTTADKIGHTIGQITQTARERLEEFDLSRDAFAKRTSERTIADEMDDSLRQYGIPAPQPADQDRVGGWSLVYQLFQAGKLFISSDCPRLIACIPTLLRDTPLRPEDVLKMEGDDPADALRYGLKTRTRAAEKPDAMRIAEKMKALAVDGPLTPHDYAMARRQIEADLNSEDEALTFLPRDSYSEKYVDQ
jgi:phage terminase large subunit